MLLNPITYTERIVKSFLRSNSLRTRPREPGVKLAMLFINGCISVA